MVQRAGVSLDLLVVQRGRESTQDYIRLHLHRMLRVEGASNYAS